MKSVGEDGRSGSGWNAHNPLPNVDLSKISPEQMLTHPNNWEISHQELTIPECRLIYVFALFIHEDLKIYRINVKDIADVC